MAIPKEPKRLTKEDVAHSDRVFKYLRKLEHWISKILQEIEDIKSQLGT